MSVNTNRAKLKKANNGREYGNILFDILYPPYCEEGWNWRTNISNQDRRAFKTWKHNRKTQWKQ